MLNKNEKDKQDLFQILRKIYIRSYATQRELSSDLGFSLGKINYCLRLLREKGLVKLKNFKNQNNKIKYLRYVLTTKGISERTRLTVNFMRKKMEEYDQLKKELKNKHIK